MNPIFLFGNNLWIGDGSGSSLKGKPVAVLKIFIDQLIIGK